MRENYVMRGTGVIQWAQIPTKAQVQTIMQAAAHCKNAFVRICDREVDAIQFLPIEDMDKPDEGYELLCHVCGLTR